MIRNSPGKQRNKLILFLLVSISLSACRSSSDDINDERVLPIVGERDVVYRMLNGKEVADTLYHHVPDFSYLNQDSVMIHSKDLKDKIWVTDFFFTHCPSICPPMTSQMKRLNKNTADLSGNLLFLSFSIDPERDTPSRLREYITEYGIQSKNWHFFTGEEEATHLLAKSFFNGAERNDIEEEGNFGHTSYFVLVDKEGLVRGIYDGTDADEVDRLESDLRKLLKYEYGINGKN